MVFAPRSLILFALPMRLPLPSDSFFLLFEQTFQMRVVYTTASLASSVSRVGYTFQMRVVYTLGLHCLDVVRVGYTFQKRVVYTHDERQFIERLLDIPFK